MSIVFINFEFFVLVFLMVADGNVDKYSIPENELIPGKETENNTLNGTDEFFYYFAFGSNLLKERLNVQIKGAVFESIGVLKNYELVFFDNGTLWMGAAASIEPKLDSHVWGCVWRVPHSFSDELDIQEIPIFVDQNSSEVKWFCRTYQYSNPERVRLPPSPHYKHVIVSGAIEHNLPKDYIEWLKQIPHNNYYGKVKLDLKVLKELNSN